MTVGLMIIELTYVVPLNVGLVIIGLTYVVPLNVGLVLGRRRGCT
jgi:hypothetical protein